MDLLALAKTIADRVEAAASRVVPVAVSIIDTHGNVILQHRMSGAPAFSLEISERRAYTSALVGGCERPTYCRSCSPARISSR
jgi:uncharacterized protein GlcG (DUF336 family)